MKNIIVITGASSGIGYEFASQLDANLLSIDEFYLIARRRDKLEELASSLVRPCKIIDGDLTDETTINKLKETLENDNVKIKMLINAAGFGKLGRVDETDEAVLAKMIDLNCKALVKVARLCIPYMAYNSRIINIASAAAFLPQPSFSVYAATKSFVLSFSRSLNRELRKYKIYVTAVCPGPVDTEFFDVAISDGESSPAYKEIFMVNCEDVVHKAISDSIAKKSVSVYSFWMKCLRVITKLIPHELILKFFR